jgi:hypothetical protein
MTKITGGCLCGSVRYSIGAEPTRQFLCYCEDCQRHSGTAFISALAVPADSTEISGDLGTFTMPGGQSGEPMHRRFCTQCGTPIYLHKDNPGQVYFMAGTLDDRALFKPQLALFCDAAPSWVVMTEGIENRAHYLA